MNFCLSYLVSYSKCILYCIAYTALHILHCNPTDFSLVCVYVCVFVYIYIYIYIYVCMFVSFFFVCVFVFCMHVCLFVLM